MFIFSVEYFQTKQCMFYVYHDIRTKLKVIVYFYSFLFQKG